MNPAVPPVKSTATAITRIETSRRLNPSRSIASSIVNLVWTKACPSAS